MTGPGSPFPSIREEDEGDFFTAINDTTNAPVVRSSPSSKAFTTQEPPKQRKSMLRPCSPLLEENQESIAGAPRRPSKSRPPSTLIETEKGVNVETVLSDRHKNAKIRAIPTSTSDHREVTGGQRDHHHQRGKSPFGGNKEDTTSIPPQTILVRVLRELEEDYAHYRAIYAELADSYKLLDVAAALSKRRILAEHLREVIDTLEKKADHIVSLYAVLEVHDKTENQALAVGVGSSGSWKSIPDILRMVKHGLGEDAIRRLESDGMVRITHHAL